MGRQVIPESEPLWKALADPTRRALLDLLRPGPRTTSQLCQHFPTTRFTIMGHLEVLVETGLVMVERRGRERFNHLNPVPLQELHARWIAPFSASAASTLLALAAASEHEEVPTMTPSVDIRAEHLIRRDAARTWACLMRLSDWWPKCWPDSERLTFEARPGGRLATMRAREGSGSADGGVIWGMVEELYPGRSLAVRGPMGLRGPVCGYWRMDLSAQGDETRVVLQHQITGPVSDEDRRCFESGWPVTLETLATVAKEQKDV